MQCEFIGNSMTNHLGEGILPGDIVHTSDQDITAQLLKEFILPDPDKYYFIESYFTENYVAKIYSVDTRHQALSFGFLNPDKVKFPVLVLKENEIKCIQEVTKVQHINVSSTGITRPLKDELKDMCRSVIYKIEVLQAECANIRTEIENYAKIKKGDLTWA